jgi:hypothetical protein
LLTLQNEIAAERARQERQEEWDAQQAWDRFNASQTLVSHQQPTTIDGGGYYWPSHSAQGAWPQGLQQVRYFNLFEAMEQCYIDRVDPTG